MSGQTKAPARQQIIDALGAYQRRGRIGDNIGKMSDLLIDESDRGVVVILGSLLEDLLLERIVLNFVNMDAAQKKNLTRAGGLLSSFDDKINLGFAMGCFDQSMVEMLQTVKAMRNACAHSRLDIGFHTPELRDALSLIFGDEENAADIRASDHALTLRLFFIGSFMFLSAVLRGESEKASNARVQGLIDHAIEEAKAELERLEASRKKRTKRSTKRPRPRPNG